jgi:hypothetical protein
MRDDQQVVVRLRPTAAQALAHGLYVGGVAGVVLGGPVALAWVFDGGPPVLGLCAVAIGGLVGAAAAGPVVLIVWRERGVDVDDVGLHPVPYVRGSFIPWRYVADMHAERRGGRIVVVLRLTSGDGVILRAPYTGGLLAVDPEFERKLFALRNRWETHRSFNIYPD